jgi:outer membrane protein TolC
VSGKAGLGQTDETVLPPPQPLTLEEAVRYGLEHNPLPQAAEEDVRGAGEGVNAAQADFYPRVDASYEYLNLKDTPIIRIKGFPGLGDTSFQSDHKALNNWQLEVRQPIFRGFELTSRHEIAKLERSIADYHLAQTRLDLMRDIQRVFLQTLLAEKLLQVTRENVSQLEARRKDAEAYFRQGLTAENDVLKADVALADARQREKADGKRVVILRSQLNRLLGMPEPTTLVLAEWDRAPGAGKGEAMDLDLQELDARAEQKRPELQAVAAAIREAEEGMRLARSSLYPHVSLAGTYFRSGKDFLAEENDFRNDHNAAIGVRVDWNWFEGGKMRANINQAAHRREALKKRREDLLKQVQIEVKDAHEQLQVAQANLTTARVAIKQAEENRRITNAQYREQVVIFSEVLDAQVFLDQAKTNYYQALYGYQLAWVDLERAVGEELGRGSELKARMNADQR